METPPKFIIAINNNNYIVLITIINYSLILFRGTGSQFRRSPIFVTRDKSIFMDRDVRLFFFVSGTVYNELLLFIPRYFC